MIGVFDLSEYPPSFQVKALRDIASFCRKQGLWELKYCFLITATCVEKRGEANAMAHGFVG